MQRAIIESTLSQLGYVVGSTTTRPTATDKEINGVMGTREFDIVPRPIGQAWQEMFDKAQYGWMRLGIPVTVLGIDNGPKEIVCRVWNYGEPEESWEFDGEYPKSYLPQDRSWPPASQSPTQAQALILFALLAAISTESVRYDPLVALSVWEGDIPQLDNTVKHMLKGRVSVQKIIIGNGLSTCTDKTLSIIKYGSDDAIIAEVV